MDSSVSTTRDAVHEPICSYDTQKGSAPAPRPRVHEGGHHVESVCLAPHDTSSRRAVGQARSRWNWALRRRAAGHSPTSVYFVCPRRIAFRAVLDALWRFEIRLVRAERDPFTPCAPRFAWPHGSVEEGASVFNRRRAAAPPYFRGYFRRGVFRRWSPCPPRGAEAGHLREEARRDVGIFSWGRRNTSPVRLQLAVHGAIMEARTRSPHPRGFPHDAVRALALHEVEEAAKARCGTCAPPRWRWPRPSSPGAAPVKSAA